MSSGESERMSSPGRRRARRGELAEREHAGAGAQVCAARAHLSPSMSKSSSCPDVVLLFAVLTVPMRPKSSQWDESLSVLLVPSTLPGSEEEGEKAGKRGHCQGKRKRGPLRSRAPAARRNFLTCVHAVVMHAKTNPAVLERISTVGSGSTCET